MSQYVDGFVIPIKKKNVKAYKKMATLGRNVWMKHGALSYFETVGDSLKIPYGIPFTQLCKLKADETAIFAFIVYKSKAHRERVNKKVHKYFTETMPADYPMPFDMKRMTTGGFQVLVRSK